MAMSHEDIMESGMSDLSEQIGGLADKMDTIITILETMSERLAKIVDNTGDTVDGLMDANRPR